MGLSIMAAAHLHILYVCLFWIRNRICPMGSTPKGGPRESSHTSQATRHPLASSLFMFPLSPYFCHAYCIRSVHTPVLYIYPTKYLVRPLLVFPSYTYILNPTQYEPLNNHQTPQNKLCYFIISNKQKSNSSEAPPHLPSWILHAYLLQWPSLTPVAPSPITA